MADNSSSPRTQSESEDSARGRVLLLQISEVMQYNYFISYLPIP